MMMGERKAKNTGQKKLGIVQIMSVNELVWKGVICAIR